MNKCKDKKTIIFFQIDSALYTYKISSFSFC